MSGGGMQGGGQTQQTQPQQMQQPSQNMVPQQLNPYLSLFQSQIGTQNGQVMNALQQSAPFQSNVIQHQQPRRSLFGAGLRIAQSQTPQGGK